MLSLSIIVAYTKNRVIGKDGVIPWSLANEKKRFKALTTGNVVIMGRKTFEEIGRPLPDRTTIVVSRSKEINFENCYTANSLEAALDICNQQFSDKEIFICGGAQLYKEALPLVSKMYITEIDTIIDGDTFFPEFDTGKFTRTLEAEFNEELPYRYFSLYRS